MLTAMLIRCEQCGHESAPRFHFCGMCGAKLPEPQPPGPPKAFSSLAQQTPKREPPLAPEPPRPLPQESLTSVGSEPIRPADPERLRPWAPDPLPSFRSEPTPPVSPEPVRKNEPGRQVSGPSFLGLADDTGDSVSYLLEDELSESHWGRSAVLFLVLIGIGFAGWHWRNELRAYVSSRLAQRPANQSEPANSTDTSGAAPGSEVGAGMPSTGTNAADKPMTGVGGVADLPPASQAQAQNVPGTSAPTATQNPPAAAPDSAPNSTPSASSANAAAAAASPPAAAVPAASANQANPDAASTQKSSGTTATAKSETPAALVTKRTKSSVSEPAPAISDADQLEAQGERYLYGTGASASCSRAQSDLQLAADRGSAKADSVLGTMYATGHCVSRDLPLAYRWFAKALAQDPSNARLQRDLQVLWNQMTADERQLAMRR